MGKKEEMEGKRRKVNGGNARGKMAEDRWRSFAMEKRRGKKKGKKEKKKNKERKEKEMSEFTLSSELNITF